MLMLPTVPVRWGTPVCRGTHSLLQVPTPPRPGLSLLPSQEGKAGGERGPAAICCALGLRVWLSLILGPVALAAGIILHLSPRQGQQTIL